MKEKPWSGRFNLPTDKFVEEFNASITYDKRLYKFDIKGSIAHAKMLSRQGIITEDEARTIVSGLEQVLQEIERGIFKFQLEDEDIHMAVEKRLTEIVGAVGGKLHTARSRNDQVAVDIRMYIIEEAETAKAYIINLQTVLVEKAINNLGVIMPGFTHLQTGQPILFSHYLMAYFQMFKRDFQRITDMVMRMNYSPLGAAAMAGTTFPIDRNFTASQLGFYGPTENSIDSVSDRDFTLEFLSALSICMMHLSRFSEELILFSNPDLGFINLSDDYCTGSSIMPQKKNPDIPELIRGKTGRIYGNLMAMLTTMKGLPLAYNKDMQEDKEPLFDSIDTVLASLKIFAPMIAKMTINEDKMRQAAAKGYSTATDLADYLVRKGLPFRQAHHVVGKTVAYAIEQNKRLDELSIDELRKFSPMIGDDIFKFITLESSVNNRNSYGGTSAESVMTQIKLAQGFLNENL
ncbi:MAG: argininosuccinate lyase [Deferribacterales bacterium]|nr:argininosuccinate lyase [Deferribacterales bacterium]